MTSVRKVVSASGGKDVRDERARKDVRNVRRSEEIFRLCNESRRLGGDVQIGVWTCLNAFTQDWKEGKRLNCVEHEGEDCDICLQTRC